MTRPDKHAARFGARYQPPIDWRRLTKAMPDILAVMRRVTEAFRQAADNMRRAREFEDTARQVEAVFSGCDILDRIDNTLLTYDSQHADGTEPWPYRGF